MAVKGVLIIEDEFLIRSELKRIVADAGFVCIGESADGVGIQHHIENEKLSLILMDIHLRDVDHDGIDLAVEIRKHSNVPILFITSLPLKEVYGRRKLISHSRELHKPPKPEDLIAQARDLINEQSEISFSMSNKGSSKNYAFFPIGKSKQLRRIDFHEISYLEADNTTCLLFKPSIEQPVRVKESMKNLEASLPSNTFVRINRSTIINIEAIASVNQAVPMSVMIGTSELTVSDKYKESLLRLIR